MNIHIPDYSLYPFPPSLPVGIDAANILANGSYEQGWTDWPNAPIQIPNHWDFYFWENQPNPYYPDWLTVRPEAVHRSKDHLPEFEWPLYILDGDWTYKVFKGWGAIRWHLRQDVPFAQPGVYRFTVRLYPDLVEDYQGGQKVFSTNPNDGLIAFRVGDRPITPWQSFNPAPDPGLEFRSQTITYDFTVTEPGTLTVRAIFFMPHPLVNNCVFLDDWSLTRLGDIPAPCKGLPRVQYQRVYALIPPGYGSEWSRAVINGSWADHRWTVGSSADDAGVGDLDDKRVIAVNPDEWPTDLVAFFDQYYPGTQVYPAYADTPEQLARVLEDWDWDDPPIPPPTPVPPIVPEGTNGFISIHDLGGAAGKEEFVQTVQPPIYKAVLNMGMFPVVEDLSPHTLPVYRHWPNMPSPQEHLDAMLPDILQLISNHPNLEPIWLEGYNEMYSQDPSVVEQAVGWDLEFCDYLQIARSRYGVDLRPLVFTAAVGNPLLPTEPGGEAQWQMILPLADTVESMGGAFGYHSYWPANIAHPEWFSSMEYAKYFHMRWAEYDKWLVQQDAYVYWMLTEGGACGAGQNFDLLQRAHTNILERVAEIERRAAEGVNTEITYKVKPLAPIKRHSVIKADGSLDYIYLDPISGWKNAYGDSWSAWERYRSELLTFSGWIADWNDANGGRCAGLTVFQTGSHEWDGFALEGDHLTDLAQYLQEQADARAIEQARRDYEAGDTTSLDDLKRELGID